MIGILVGSQAMANPVAVCEAKKLKGYAKDTIYSLLGIILCRSLSFVGRLV